MIVTVSDDGKPSPKTMLVSSTRTEADFARGALGMHALWTLIEMELGDAEYSLARDRPITLP